MKKNLKIKKSVILENLFLKNFIKKTLLVYVIVSTNYLKFYTNFIKKKIIAINNNLTTFKKLFKI